MARRKLQTFDRYCYGKRGVLACGDRFRVTGGPIYITDDGQQIPMYERGLLIFSKYCVQGAAKWIEAQRADGGGIAILWVGKSCRSRSIPNIRRRPYRVTSKLKTGNGRRKSISR